jgi:hypothetical protein
MKIRAEINEIATKKYKELFGFFFEKPNKIDRPPAKLTKMRREKHPNQ